MLHPGLRPSEFRRLLPFDRRRWFQTPGYCQSLGGQPQSAANNRRVVQPWMFCPVAYFCSAMFKHFGICSCFSEPGEIRVLEVRGKKPKANRFLSEDRGLIELMGSRHFLVRVRSSLAQVDLRQFLRPVASSQRGFGLGTNLDQSLFAVFDFVEMPSALFCWHFGHVWYYQTESRHAGVASDRRSVFSWQDIAQICFYQQLGLGSVMCKNAGPRAVPINIDEVLIQRFL